MGCALARQDANEVPGASPGVSILRRAFAAAMAITIVSSLLLPLVAAAKPATHTDVRADVRPAAPERAGRDFFRIRTVGALPTAPSRAVRHPAKVVKSAPKKTVAPRRKRASAPAPAMPRATGSVAVLLAFLYAQLGEPYRFGAAGPNAWDCSGLVDGAYLAVGIRLPHKAAAFYGVGRAVPRSQVRAGDIIVMNGGGHAGIAISATMMIHAPHTGDHVRLAPITGFSAARRLL